MTFLVALLIATGAVADTLPTAPPPVEREAPPAPPWTRDCPDGTVAKVETMRVGCTDCDPKGTVFTCRNDNGQIHGPFWMTAADGAPYTLRERDRGRNVGRETLWKFGRIHSDGYYDAGQHVGWWMLVSDDLSPRILHASENPPAEFKEIVAIVQANPGLTGALLAKRLPNEKRHLAADAIKANALHEHATEGWVEWRRYEKGRVVDKAYSPRPEWAGK